MFRPGHPASLAITLTLDEPPRSYSRLTFTQPRNAAQQVLSRLPYHSWQSRPNLFTAIWEMVLFEMWPFDAVTGVGKHTAVFSLRAGPISPSVRSKYLWDVSL
jgi:hypothetical protein